MSSDADPQAVDSFFAVIGVYMLSSLDDDPPWGTTPALRDHQRYCARIFLDCLANHRGWV